MTPPALVLLRPSRSRRPLDTALAALRPDIPIRVASPDAELAAAVSDLVAEGAAEVIVVPLQAAASASTEALAGAVASVAQLVASEAPVSLASPLGATGGCFAALDRQLHDALVTAGAREIDALVLWHDATQPDDVAKLERRARRWAAHHRLPYQLASLGHPRGIDAAVAAHREAGHRHVAIATLAIEADPRELARAARLPGVVGVGRPLGDDPAVTQAILARYAVAAMEALEAPLAS